MKLLLHFLTFIKLLVAIHGFALPSTNHEYERIIDNFEDILNGVPVDFRYNESDSNTKSSSGELTSVPGCPKSEEGIPWIYYGSPRKCYLAGEVGPCNVNEILFVEMGSPFGICNCQCFQYNKAERLSSNETKFCFQLARENVFHPGFKKCFTLYDQGPCESNEWLIKDMSVNSRSNQSAGVRCEARKCPLGQIPVDDRTNPKCIIPQVYFGAPGYINPNKCEDGERYSKLLKRCVNAAPTFYIGR